MTAQPTATQAGVSQCPWCGAAVSSADLSCPGCGATVQRSKRATDSGWNELPPIRDMARLQVGSSTCQIEGLYVPVADFNLAAGDGVYFAHHSILWKDPQVEVRRMSLKGALNRLFAGLPMVMTEAHGPGHIAFSRDEPGESILIEPGGFLYKDASVTMNVEMQRLGSFFTGVGMAMARMTGPGRVGIQSMYRHHKSE